MSNPLSPNDKKLQIKGKLYDSIELEEERIDYTIFPRENSTKQDILEISIQKDEGLVVKAPMGMELGEIRDQLIKKSNWIMSKLLNLDEIKDKPLPRELVSGEKFPYLGRRYFLEVVPKPAYKKKDTYDTEIVGDQEDQSTKFTFYRGKFWIYIPEINGQILKELDNDESDLHQRIKSQITDWYKMKALAKFQKRARYYSELLNVNYEKVRLRDLKRKWGTCTPKKYLHFNWKIILAPISIVDYVIVHELVHLLVPNHSHKYWNKLKTVLPDMEERREWLRINGPTLDI